MILRKLLDLTDLTKAQTLYVHKPTLVIMVTKDKNFIFATLQMVMPGLKSLNNSKNFTIMSSVARIIFLEK